MNDIMEEQEKEQDNLVAASPSMRVKFIVLSGFVWSKLPRYAKRPES